MEQKETQKGTEPIPYQVLIELHKNYKKHKRKLLSDDLWDKEETASIVFEKKKIKDFLIELLADEVATGIRIYLCAYDDQQEDYPSVSGKVPENPNHIKQLTVGMVAVQTVGYKFVDYYPNSRMMVAPPINHGTLCPPDEVCPTP